jgi:predicted metal-dependent HD superfamily phosphohydrolase
MRVPFDVLPELSLPEPLLQEVLAAYGEPQRAYHGVSHLVDVLARFTALAREGAWVHPREVYLALLFHDVVYVPGASDNEEASAELALRALARWLPDARVDAERVAHLVRLTARHGYLSRADVSEEEALFLDCDMAVLGASPAAYDAYERGIAQEYAAIPPELFAAGRRRFLEGLLAHERIFLSERFHTQLDAAARENLRRALEEARIPRLTELADRVRGQRTAGEVIHHATRIHLATDAPRSEVVRSIDHQVAVWGLSPLGESWVELRREDAVSHLVSVLRWDLAYSLEVLAPEKSVAAAEAFVGAFSSSTRFFTNGELEKRMGTCALGGWAPITGATFDTGLVGIDAGLLAILWVTDED